MSDEVSIEGKKLACKPFKMQARINGHSGVVTIPKWAIRSGQIVPKKEYAIAMYELDNEQNKEEETEHVESQE